MRGSRATSAQQPTSTATTTTRDLTIAGGTPVATAPNQTEVMTAAPSADAICCTALRDSLARHHPAPPRGGVWNSGPTRSTVRAALDRVTNEDDGILMDSVRILLGLKVRRIEPHEFVGSFVFVEPPRVEWGTPTVLTQTTKCARDDCGRPRGDPIHRIPEP